MGLPWHRRREGCMQARQRTRSIDYNAAGSVCGSILLGVRTQIARHDLHLVHRPRGARQSLGKRPWHNKANEAQNAQDYKALLPPLRRAPRNAHAYE